MSTSQSQMTCENPACRRTVNRRDAFLRSVSLTQVAFCSAACVEVFGQLDESARRPAPVLRRQVAGRVR